MRFHVQVLVLCLKDTMTMCLDFSELVLVWQQIHVPTIYAGMGLFILDTYIYILLIKSYRLA